MRLQWKIPEIYLPDSSSCPLFSFLAFKWNIWQKAGQKQIAEEIFYKTNPFSRRLWTILSFFLMIFVKHLVVVLLVAVLPLTDFFKIKNQNLNRKKFPIIYQFLMSKAIGNHKKNVVQLFEIKEPRGGGTCTYFYQSKNSNLNQWLQAATSIIWVLVSTKVLNGVWQLLCARAEMIFLFPLPPRLKLRNYMRNQLKKFRRCFEEQIKFFVYPYLLIVV